MRASGWPLQTTGRLSSGPLLGPYTTGNRTGKQTLEYKSGSWSKGMSELTQKAITQLDSIISKASSSGAATTERVPPAASTPAAANSTGLQGGMNGAANDRVESIQQVLEQIFHRALQKAFPDLQERPIVLPTKEPKFGDYQFNNAMKLFAMLKGKEGAPKNPQAVSQAIVDSLEPTDVLSQKPEIAGPGFVNLRINPKFLEDRLNGILANGMSKWGPKLPYNRAVVDFSSPNVAKEMHVGHLRSTIIGDTISRTLEFCGLDVLRLNHVGDWGTQFGMLIQNIAETREGGLEGNGGTTVEEVSDLQKLYRESKTRFDEDVEFKQRARNSVTQLQSGSPQHIKAWERICEASRREFQAVYDRLGVKLQERGESFYNPMLSPLVQELMAMGLAIESEGAKIINVEGGGYPLMLQKSDGGYGYGTTDMAAIRNRLRDEKCDFLIYVTDLGQSGHFDLVFGAARMAGFVPDGARIDHVGFGVVLNEDGQRIKTRSGETVRLAALLDEAKSRCKETLQKRAQEKGESISEDELEKTAKIMGYAAVKYMDLKNNRKTDYKFSYDAMLELRGNTAVYLLYAHARIASITRKSGVDINELKKTHQIKLEHNAERALGLHLARFPEAIKEMLEEMQPNRITEFVYDLSQLFSSFYDECKVVGSPEQNSRLLLCEVTGIVMRQCFYLLGITPLYKI